jgi:hypothetical protein
MSKSTQKIHWFAAMSSAAGDMFSSTPYLLIFLLLVTKGMGIYALSGIALAAYTLRKLFSIYKASISHMPPGTGLAYLTKTAGLPPVLPYVAMLIVAVMTLVISGTTAGKLAYTGYCGVNVVLSKGGFAGIPFGEVFTIIAVIIGLAILLVMIGVKESAGVSKWLLNSSLLHTAVYVIGGAFFISFADIKHFLFPDEFWQMTLLEHVTMFMKSIAGGMLGCTGAEVLALIAHHIHNHNVGPLHPQYFYCNCCMFWYSA